MTNRFLVSVAALALIAGTGLANAQGTAGREPGGAQMQSPPQSTNAPKSQGHSNEMNAQSKQDRSHETTGQGGGPANINRSQRTEENAPAAKSQGHSNEMNAQSKQDRSHTTTGQSGGPANMNRNSRAEENAPGARSQGQANERNAESRQDRSHTTTGQGGGPANMNRNPRAEENAPAARSQGQTGMNAETRQDRSHMTTGQAGAGAKLSTDQRTRITTVIRNERVAPVNNVDFAVSIGTRVPREHVSLRPLPTEVVSIYPAWRGYEFFLVRDQIVVVDPRSLEIVAILEA